jgi:LAO/AO transport system kinase
MTDAASAAQLLARLKAGERRALARALSDAESRHPGPRARLDELWRLSGAAPNTALRVAFTGPPGAGKSSLLERVGMQLLAQGGTNLAVLPIDPSSQASGGSVLADQTRMTELSRHPRVFIRPSASGRVLGGLAAHTQESIELCELAGYDWVVVETVGVGQSEVDAAATADVVILVLTPDAGDELQAMKRGITEVCHAIVVNKAEAEREPAARELARQYLQAAQLLGHRQLDVFVASAQSGLGLAELAEWLAAQRMQWLGLHAEREQRRRAQRLFQFERAVGSGLLPRLLTRTDVRARYDALCKELGAGALSVPGALEQFFSALESPTR